MFQSKNLQALRGARHACTFHRIDTLRDTRALNTQLLHVISDIYRSAMDGRSFGQNQ